MGDNAAPVRVNKVILHIGTEKTGTSSIQHFLSNMDACRRWLSTRRWLGGATFWLQSLAARMGRWRSQTQRMSAAGLPPVFLHMGLPKTATTTLQNTLFSQHPGICYLGKRSGWEPEKGCASAEIDRALRPIFWHRGEPIDPVLVRSVLQAHSRERGPEKPILGSWEALLVGRPAAFQAMLREAKNIFGDVRLVVTLRNPLKRLPSAYLHALKSCTKTGKHHTIPKGRVFLPFDEWLAGSRRGLTTHNYRFDFDENLRFAVKLLGKDKVGVFLMEDMIENRQTFFADILNFMGVDDAGVELIEDKHLNPALTTAQLNFLKTIDASKEKRKQWLALGRRERRLRMNEIAKTGNSEKYTIVLTDAQRELVEARSGDLNRWLVETFGLDLERHNYPL